MSLHTNVYAHAMQDMVYCQSNGDTMSNKCDTTMEQNVVGVALLFCEMYKLTQCKILFIVRITWK